MYRIFLVEDNTALASELCALLCRWDYEPIRCRNFRDVLGECLAAQPHAVIMDVNLPHLDGFTWCARIRRASSVPVLFLSARDEAHDAVRAIEGGGDDYLTKPFAPQMLIAKLGSLLRRAYEYAPPGASALSAGGATLDMTNAQLAFGDARLDLTRNELKLLSLLMERRGQLVPRNELMQLLWDDDVYVNENSLTVSVNRLRKRLEGIGLDGYIATRKGVGYGILDS